MLSWFRITSPAYPTTPHISTRAYINKGAVWCNINCWWMTETRKSGGISKRSAFLCISAINIFSVVLNKGALPLINFHVFSTQHVLIPYHTFINFKQNFLPIRLFHAIRSVGAVPSSFSWMYFKQKIVQNLANLL